MKASEARKVADAYYQSLVDAHAKEYKAMKIAERRAINTLKNNGHWDALVAKIEGHVKRISAKGGRSLEELEYMAFYLKGTDRILFDDIKHYFEGRGFTVKEYADCGLQLQW